MKAVHLFLVVAFCVPATVSNAADILIKDHAPDPAETHKTRFEKYLAVRIGELNRVCDLSDKQLKKLEVAKKGAIEEALQKLADQHAPNQQWQAFGVRNRLHVRRAIAVDVAPVPHQADVLPADEVRLEPAAAAEPPAEPEDEPAEEGGAPEEPAGDEAVEVHEIVVAPPAPAAFPAGAFAPQIVDIHAHGHVDPAMVANTVVWQNAIRHVLTPAQSQLYEQAQEERAQFRRRTLVQRAMTGIDAQLFLSDDQRTKLAQHLWKTLGKDLDEVMPKGAAMPDAHLAAQVAARVSKQSLTHLLDPAQIARWDELQTPQHGNVVFFGWGGGR